MRQMLRGEASRKHVADKALWGSGIRPSKPQMIDNEDHLALFDCCLDVILTFVLPQGCGPHFDQPLSEAEGLKVDNG